MEFPDRDEILYHKPIWGTNPFLLCRTVTPADLRDSRSRCNCRDCYLSRIRSISNYLSHPFGSRSDPPRGPFEFSSMLRSKNDMVHDVFATDNSIVLLNMIFSGSEIVATNDRIYPVNSIDFIRDRVRDRLTDDPGDRSLNGLFFSRLKVFDLRRKGPRLLRRARRSHSIPPSVPLYDLPEIVDTWCSGSHIFREPDIVPPDFVANFPGSIEQLVHKGHFHDRQGLKFDFRSFIMSDQTPRRRKRSRSVVS